ncbi:tyrosine-type recombinase/integrase [Gemmobacter sp. 24YEA27]|uniref:tyrosine-type recombinase/integrase n=1 Tax=Gemmobacter sp. 24YEA27 TaxID=3040672 RepID=UPI0024B34103|nr:tyrosine-type recombinase/integrase [Gemmobacter sp. 24YEA27]
MTSSDVLEILCPIWVAKAETAPRIRQRISKVMKSAIARGWRKDNPAIGLTDALPKQSEPRQRRRALPYNEVAGLLATVHQSKAGLSTRLCLEFLILTCARSLEARGARWQEIDFETRAWNVPADRMKMKRPHRVPLSKRAIALLREAEGELSMLGTVRKVRVPASHIHTRRG